LTTFGLATFGLSTVGTTILTAAVAASTARDAMRKTAAPFANFSCPGRWLGSAGFGAFCYLTCWRSFFRGERVAILGGLFFGHRLAQDHSLDVEIFILIQQRRGDRTRLSGVFGVSSFGRNRRLSGMYRRVG
jgi:hypothetical protein